jgi:hypothetical protein
MTHAPLRVSLLRTSALRSPDLPFGPKPFGRFTAKLEHASTSVPASRAFRLERSKSLNFELTHASDKNSMPVKGQ